MIGSPDGKSWPSLDEAVEAYESARARDGRVELADFLPDPRHPEYLAILCELIRVELEYSWQQGDPVRLDDYRARFPELFHDRRWLQELAFEEFRLRRQAGEDPSPLEYRRCYGAGTLDWPSSLLDDLGGDPGTGETGPAICCARNEAIGNGIATAATLYRASRDGRAREDADLEALFAARGIPREPAELFEDLDRSDPPAARRLARAITSFPETGTTFLGFRLEAELGRGAFGRVYLARQGDLANRPVALKIATDVFSETNTLAQLQHTNIVPIYSVHRSGPLQAVCMPYLGSSTLADVLNDLKRKPALPESGAGLLSTRERKVPTADARPGTSDCDASAGPASTPDPAEDRAAASLRPAEIRATAQVERLRSLDYVRAVLWLIARVADGLAHAHEHGILHRDLKPANILVGNDGEPLLLDFNLASDNKLRGSASGALIGGTLPYMAPEHLNAYRTGTLALDQRCDVYSLGVILFELLTGRHPFEIRTGPVHKILASMIADRLEPPPALRPWNPRISPAVESIVK